MPECYLVKYVERYPAPYDDDDDWCPEAEEDGPDHVAVDLDGLDLTDPDDIRAAVRAVDRAVETCGEPSCCPLPAAGDLDHVWITGDACMDPRTGESERPSFHRGTVPSAVWAAFLRHRFVK